MRFARCSEALYYDLIKTPHGHIPAPKVKVWSWLPIPISGYRNDFTFSCPCCGSPSFFKLWDCCRECEYYGGYQYDAEKWKLKRRREKWRNRWKQLEYAILPLLVLFGKASYLRTTRINVRDYEVYGGSLTDELRKEISAERAEFMKKYGMYL